MDFFSKQYAFADGDLTVIIGEVGVNHNGDPAIARRLVDVAVEAGVDIVKFQAFKTEQEISRFAPKAPYQEATAPDAANQFDLVKALELSSEDFTDLQSYCRDRQIGFLCSIFDFESLAFLADELKVSAVKVASGEITNFPFLEVIGRRKLSVILSTGGSTLDEVAAAISVLKAAGCPELVLMHCVSSYPAPIAELNLRAMDKMKAEFGLPVGFSDHSIGTEAAIAAASLGAAVIEKHFTLSRTMKGPDHAASLEPDDLKRLVAGVRIAHDALGDGIKCPTASEAPNVPLIRRSLVAKRRLHKGERLTQAMIEIKRPASGISPGDLDKIIGRELGRDLEDDEPITWSSLVP